MNEYLTTMFECLVYLAFFPGLPLTAYIVWSLIEEAMDKWVDEIHEENVRFKKYQKMFDEMHKG